MSEPVSIDYIRLATWDFKLYCDLSATIRRKYVGWYKSRWLQYKMERSQDNVSYGLGQQNKKPHAIIEASGVDAHVFFHWLITTQEDSLDRLYCVRLDLQSTRKPSKPFDYVKAHKRLRKPKGLRLGDTGNTLYIGNRESNSFWRIYDKSDTHIRVEVELKGKQAQGGWLFLTHKPDCIHELYAGHLKRSRVPNVLAKEYMDGHTPADLEEIRVIVPEDLDAKLQWLGTLDALIYKLANDHDTNARMQILMSRWHEYTLHD